MTDAATPTAALSPPPYWDWRTVRLWIREAADTERRLSDPERSWLYRTRSSMPEIVRTRAEMDYADKTDHLGPATRQAIGRLWCVVEWLRWLKGKQHSVVVQMARGKPVVAIARRAKCSRQWCYELELRACMAIAGRLNT